MLGLTIPNCFRDATSTFVITVVSKGDPTEHFANNFRKIHLRIFAKRLNYTSINLDLLMRVFLPATVFLLSATAAVAQNEVFSTIVDDTVTLDITTITGARSVIIYEEQIQQEATPSVATKTTEPNGDGSYLLPSVDTISGAEVRTYQRYDIASVFRQSAGVSVTTLGGEGGQTSVFVRGMESDHTVVLLNGRRLPRGLAGLYQVEFLDVSNLESLQFSRGPASSLYGSDAIAGAIGLRTTDARFIESNTVSSYFEGGSFDTFRSGGKVAIREGRLGVSLDASFVDTSNDRVASSDYDNRTLRGNFAYELSDGIYLDVLGSIQSAFLEVPGQRSVAGVPTLSFPADQTNTNQSGLFSPRVSIIRDDWDFSTFYSYTVNSLSDLESPGFFGNIDSRLEQEGHEWETQFNYRPTSDVTLTLGGGHYQYRFERIPLLTTSLPAAELEYAFTSIFAQADIALPANFHLLTSGRYDDHGSYKSKGTYTAQLSYLAEQTGTTIFGKVGTGYKAPNGQDLIFTDTLTTPSDLVPEESFTYEFGLAQSICNENGEISFTYFNNDIDHLVDNDPLTFGAGQVDTESSGFEAEFRVFATDKLELYTNYTYLDANVVNGTYLFADTAGNRLIRRPRHTVAAGAVYSADRWQIGAEINGAYDRDDRGTFPDQIDLGGYTVARIFGNFKLNDNFELYGRFENAFDEQYDYSDGYEAPGLGAFVGARIYLSGSSNPVEDIK